MVAVSRRNFIIGSTTLIASPLLSTTSTYAWVQIIGAVTAVASFASQAVSFFSRGGNPTLTLIMSISKQLDALDTKVNVLMTKIDEIQKDINILKKDVVQLPTAIIEEENINSIKTNIEKSEEVFSSKESYDKTFNYYNDLNKLYFLIEDSIRKLITNSEATGFDSIFHIIIAYDVQYRLALELSSVESFNSGVQFEIVRLYNSNKNFISYLEDSIFHATLGFSFIASSIAKEIKEQRPSPKTEPTAKLVSLA